MLRSVKDIEGYAIRATDGVIGDVADFYFDDDDWAIRYLIVDTGGWLSGRHVLISPLAIGHPDWMDRRLPVALTKAQVAHSPDIDTRKPVSRQHEAEYFGYYEYPPYWGGTGLWGLGAYPGSLAEERRIDDRKARAESARTSDDDCHLRSCSAVIGSHLHATDGDIGHVTNLLVDDHTWAIRYLVVATTNWWVGHHVLVAPQWIVTLNWPESSVRVDVTRQAVKDAPPYDPAAQFNREQEQGLYEHHGRRDYWTYKVVGHAALSVK